MSDYSFISLFERLERIENSLQKLAEQKGQPNETTIPELMTRQEVAEMFGASLGTINNLANRGQLKKYKIGGQVRYKREEVIQAMREVNGQPK